MSKTLGFQEPWVGGVGAAGDGGDEDGAVLEDKLLTVEEKRDGRRHLGRVQAVPLES
jgi:hypothetical protein